MISGIGIGLIGAARSGKDAVAERLVHAYDFRRFAFADEMKRIYHDLFGHSEEKPREGYQWFGQAMRERDPQIWIRKLFYDITFNHSGKAYHYGGDHYAWEKRIVITDVRLSNEYIRLQSEGFHLIRVNCPLDIRIQRMRDAGDQFSIGDLSHETETYIDTFTPDFEIDNSGKVTDTFEQFDVIMREIFAKEAVKRGVNA